MIIPSVQTPIPILNVLGGLRYGTIVELYGPFKSGKSTTAYQMMAGEMKNFPDGKYLLLDPEGAKDELRLEHVFGIDMSALKVEVKPTLEENFELLIEMTSGLKEGQHCIAIWDTIAACSTKTQFDTKDPFGGGRQEDARVIKFWLKQLMSHIVKRKVLVLVLNQVYHGDHGSYVSGGGEALKHNCHYSLKFSIDKMYYDERNVATATFSRLETDKSRYFPAVKKIPVWIDSTEGGIIDYNRSLLLAALEYGFVNRSKNGYYWIGKPQNEMTEEEYANTPKQLAANFQKNEDHMRSLEKKFEQFFRERYRLIDLLYGQDKKPEENE